VKRREVITLLGGAAVWSSVAEAQTARKRPVMGVLTSGTPNQWKGLRFRQSFMNGMQDLGLIVGSDFDIVARAAVATADLPRAAEELVQLNPDVIFAGSGANALAVKNATSSIPIVVAALGNLPALGLDESDTRRPRGNITGIMPYVRGLPAKQLELARDLVPSARKLGILNDTSDMKAAPQWEEMNAAAAKLGIAISGADATAMEDVEPAFRKFAAEGVHVAIVLQSNFLILDRANIVAAAAATRLPTVFGYRELVEAGGLVSYGVNLDYCFHRAATYVYKILKGTSVADLPIEFPTKLELVINLKTAGALGLDIPPTLLARADEVIE
jgi:putative ABC transport system substrate-binding protein